MPTLTQEGGPDAPRVTRKVQLFLDEDVFLRLKYFNAKTKTPLGVIVSGVLRHSLPELGEVS